jgi:hypothetical protein
MTGWDGTPMKSTVGERPVNKRRSGPRRRRADFESIKATRRDFELLEFVGSLRDRWTRAGWVHSGLLAVGAPSFAWLTNAGATVGSSPFRLWEPNHGLASHIQAVTDIRIMLERETQLGDWECERMVAQTMARGRTEGIRSHLPDGVLHIPSGRVAVEVELTLKSRVRLNEIVAALTNDYHEVWYFVPHHLEQALAEIKAYAPRQNIRIQRYPPTS